MCNEWCNGRADQWNGCAMNGVMAKHISVEWMCNEWCNGKAHQWNGCALVVKVEHSGKIVKDSRHQIHRKKLLQLRCYVAQLKPSFKGHHIKGGFYDKHQDRFKEKHGCIYF